MLRDDINCLVTPVVAVIVNIIICGRDLSTFETVTIITVLVNISKLLVFDPNLSMHICLTVNLD